MCDKLLHSLINSTYDVMLKVYCFAPSGLSLVSPVCVVFPLSSTKPLPVYLSSLLFSLTAEPPSLWTNTFRKTSAPPQNHFYHCPRQYTLTKGLEKAGLARVSNVHRENVHHLTPFFKLLQCYCYSKIKSYMYFPYFHISSPTL